MLTNSAVFHLFPIVFLAASAGCASIIGLEPGEKGDPMADSGAGGGSAGSGGANSGGGSDRCNPGEQEACYDGPATTKNIGDCKAGTHTCKPDGSGFGPCEDQVLPAAEVCGATDKSDANCNGYTCSEALWGNSYGDADLQFGEKVAADADGNVVIVGSFLGSVNFGGAALSSAGDNDVFIAKFGRDGKHIWSKRFGDAAAQHGNSVAFDAMGNVLVTGTFDGAIDFSSGASGSTPLQSAGMNDVFIAKLSPSGDLLWQTKLGDGVNQTGRAIAADSEGNIVTCGSFQGEIKLSEASSLLSAGDSDAYLLSFDPQGGLRWAKRFGDSNTQSCEALAVSASGDIVITGPFKGTVNFGGDPLTSSADFDSYVASFDKDGAPRWSIALAGPGEQRSNSVAFGPDGAAAVVGYMSGPMTVGTSTVSGAGAADVFVVKLDAKGGYVWGSAYGDVGNQFADDVAIDPQGNIFLVGYFNGKIDFGGGLMSAQGAGTDDLFIAKLEPTAGGPLWSINLGDEADQYATSVAFSPAGDLYVGGQIDGAVLLGDGIVKTHGAFDIFLARFEP